MSLFDELKRRKVLQTAAIYVAVAWGATEIIVTIADKFSLGDWVSQIAIIAFIVGFPITLLASWYVDISASGFRATTPGKPLGAKSIGALVVVTMAATGLLWLLISPSDLDYAEGALLVLQGDTRKGLDLLEAAAMRGWLGWPIMRHDPKLATLNGNPRFDKLTAGPATGR